MRGGLLEGGLAAAFDDAVGVRELPLEGVDDRKRVSQVPGTTPLAEFDHLCEKQQLISREFGFDVGFCTLYSRVQNPSRSWRMKRVGLEGLDG